MVHVCGRKQSTRCENMTSAHKIAKISTSLCTKCGEQLGGQPGLLSSVAISKAGVVSGISSARGNGSTANQAGVKDVLEASVEDTGEVQGSKNRGKAEEESILENAEILVPPKDNTAAHGEVKRHWSEEVREGQRSKISEVNLEERPSSRGGWVEVKSLTSVLSDEDDQIEIEKPKIEDEWISVKEDPDWEMIPSQENDIPKNRCKTQ